MVDPYKITDFARSDAELQELFLFCVAVAGKKAVTIAPKVHAFLEESLHPGTPFEKVRAMISDGSLDNNLRAVRLGKYDLLSRCLRQAIDLDLDLRLATISDLEAIHGISNKTSRFFLLHSRADERLAVIDTHVLKYLRGMGVDRVPSTVPTGKDYQRLESIILQEADRYGMRMADFDLRIWSHYASGNPGMPPFDSSATGFADT